MRSITSYRWYRYHPPIIAEAIGLVIAVAALGALLYNRHFEPRAVQLLEKKIWDRPATKAELFPLLKKRQVNALFSNGERLDYRIKYKGITVGKATLAVEPTASVNSRPALKIESTARSTAFFDRFFRVRDTNTAIVDKSSLATISFNQNLSEGKYKAERKLTVDYRKNRFAYIQNSTNWDGAVRGAIREPLNDVLSAFFFARTLPLEPGKTYRINILHGGETIAIPIKVREHPSSVKTPAGRFKAIALEPEFNGDSIFSSKGGKLVIWLTNDERRLPILIEAKISVGSVKVLLSGAER